MAYIVKRYSAKQLSENLPEILNEAYHSGEPFVINLDGQDILLGSHNQVEEFKQFDLWTADLPPRKGGHGISGRRPVIIVSNDEGNPENPMVTIALPNREGFQDYSYGQDKNYIALTYWDGIVVSITTYLTEAEGGEANWHDKYDLACGKGSKEDMVLHYGETDSLISGYSPEGRLVHAYRYYFDAEGNRLDNAVSASFSTTIAFYEDNGSIYYISTSSEHTNSPSADAINSKEVGESLGTFLTPYGYITTTYSANVTGKRYEYDYKKDIYVWKNTQAITKSGEFFSDFSVENTFNTDITGSKTVIESAVAFDVDESNIATWRKNAIVNPGQTMIVDVQTKYLVKDVNVTKKVKVWLNSTVPTTTVIRGTGSARLYYSNEAFITVS